MDLRIIGGMRGAGGRETMIQSEALENEQIKSKREQRFMELLEGGKV